HGGDTHPSQLAIGEPNLLLELLASDTRDARRDERLSSIDHHTGRRTIGGAHDAPTRRIGYRGTKDRRLHRFPVGESRVTVHACEVDRVVWSGRAEQVVRRPIRLGPVVLIPSAPDDPFTGPGVGHATAAP